MGSVNAFVAAAAANPYLTLVANLVQVSAIPLALWAWYHLTCRLPWCFRHGEHPVEGSSWKVCRRHHTAKHHDYLRLLHREKHPERLTHGES